MPAAPPGLCTCSPETSTWRDGAALGVLEKRSFLPVADWEADWEAASCFIAMRVEDVARLHVRGSSWGERSAGASEAARKEHWDGFLERVGARPTSKDVHWPMSLALRISATLSLLHISYHTGPF